MVADQPIVYLTLHHITVKPIDYQVVQIMRVL